MDRFERYQAEALVYRNMPVESLMGIVCHTDGVKKRLDGLLSERNIRLRVVTKPSWYFG